MTALRETWVVMHAVILPLRGTSGRQQEGLARAQQIQAHGKVGFGSAQAFIPAKPALRSQSDNASPSSRAACDGAIGWHL